MSRSKPKTSAEITTPPSIWDQWVGAIACLGVLAVPFFPDEKLIRLKMHALEIFIFLMISVLGLRTIWTSKRLSIPNPVWIGCVAWIGINLILFGMSSDRAFAGAEVRRLILGAAALIAFAAADFKSEWYRRVLIGWVVAAAVLSAYGILQRTGGIGPIQVPQMNRVMGTYGNPIFFAAFLVSSICVTLSCLASSKTNPAKFFYATLGVLQGIALFLTQTRAAWIAIAVVVIAGIFLGLTRYRWIFLLAAVLGGGFFIYETKQVWTRDQAHALIWRDTVRMWNDHPVSGVGLGRYHIEFPAYAQDDLKKKWPQDRFIVNYAHNEYLQMLAEGGLIGLGGFLGLMAAFFWVVWKRQGTDRWLTLGVAALLIQNFFSVDMRFGVSFASCFMLIGLVVSPPRQIEQPIPMPMNKTARVQLAIVWLFLMVLGVYPLLRKPYQAQREVDSQQDFFDQRLLDPAKSISDLEQLAAQHPTEPSVIEKLAYVYAKEIKNAEGQINFDIARKSIATYQKLIELDPERVGAYNNMANIHYTIGEPDQAIDMWKKAVQIKPDFLDAHLNLAKTLYAQGRLKESAAALEHVLQIDPNNAEAIVYRKRMVE